MAADDQPQAGGQCLTLLDAAFSFGMGSSRLRIVTGQPLHVTRDALQILCRISGSAEHRPPRKVSRYPARLS